MKFPFQLMPANDFDVIGFGTNAVDYLIRVPEYPAFNSKVELTDYTLASGGEVASTMTGLQRLGLKTAYVGRFGGDQAGAAGMRSLVDEGVDTGYAETVADAQTQVAFILIDEKSGERTIIWHRDSRLVYSEDRVPLEAVLRGKVLHMTPHDTRACIRLARTAKQNGVIVSIDVDNVFDGIDELLSLVDICIASTEFTEKLLGISNNKLALREIGMRFGCAVTGMTLGASGSILLCEGSFIETRAFKVPGGCVDTTGAGDAFRAGFLYGMINGEMVEESARIANAVAALKCRRLGARAGLPIKREVEVCLKKLWT